MDTVIFVAGLTAYIFVGVFLSSRNIWGGKYLNESYSIIYYVTKF